MKLETVLAGWLRYGTWLATLLTAAGLGFAYVAPGRMELVKAGIGLFILLPVARVALMLIYFARKRDYRFAGIAGAVLTIIFLGMALGIALGSRMGQH